MPHTTTYGTEDSANIEIGAITTVYYLDFFSQGRDQILHLMLVITHLSPLLRGI